MSLRITIKAKDTEDLELNLIFERLYLSKFPFKFHRRISFQIRIFKFSLLRVKSYEDFFLQNFSKKKETRNIVRYYKNFFPISREWTDTWTLQWLLLNTGVGGGNEPRFIVHHPNPLAARCHGESRQ